MQRGSVKGTFQDRTNPIEKRIGAMIELRGFVPGPPAVQIFRNAGREHREKYQTPDEAAKITFKNHRNSVNNPYSQLRSEHILEQIQRAPMVFEPLTKLQRCSTSDGASCTILASEEFVKKHGLEGQAVEIIG